MRKCVGCQQMFPKRELIRIVLGTDGTVSLDPTGKRNGRGAYLCGKPDCLKTARKRKSLERALKSPMPESLYEQLAMHAEGADRLG
ncbi:MAG: YlxR family protein [Alicyclobacillaceae bacterium]|nr:YlxR family protein [Alicyclobacillaceae bacterium]